jgi:hypothetical protein
LQLPKVRHPKELAQWESSATHAPPCATQRPASRQSTDWAHSLVDPATHLPPLIEQSPRRLQSGPSLHALCGTAAGCEAGFGLGRLSMTTPLVADGRLRFGFGLVARLTGDGAGEGSTAEVGTG